MHQGLEVYDLYYGPICIMTMSGPICIMTMFILTWAPGGLSGGLLKKIKTIEIIKNLSILAIRDVKIRDQYEETIQNHPMPS